MFVSKSQANFLAVFAVFIFGLMLCLLANTAVQVVGAATSIGAICAGIFHLIRDEFQRHHERQLSDQGQVLSIGAMSHMAKITFDKHVEFCEAYVQTFAGVLHALLTDGPTRKCIQHASDLTDIRERYALWLTHDIKVPLIALENALREIGRHERMLEVLPVSEERSQRVDSMYNLFYQILPLKNDSEENFEERAIAASKIMDHLRDILKVTDFTKLRDVLIKKSLVCLSQ